MLLLPDILYGIYDYWYLNNNGAGFDFFSPSKPFTMNIDLILKSDALDLLFENRNKAYGAYTLRKFYPDRMKISLAIVFISAALLSAITLFPDSSTATSFYTVIQDIVTRDIQEDKQFPEPKKLLHNVNKSSQSKLRSTIVIVPKADTTNVLNDISDTRIGSTTSIGTELGPADDIVGSGPVSSLPKVTVEPIAPVDKPYDNPDIQASFPGGEKALIRFLERNLQTPVSLESNETVQVKVKFVVDFEGDLQSFNIDQDGGNEFNNEVIRVLKKMPRWNPGKKGGQNVPVFYTIPVKFTSVD